MVKVINIDPSGKIRLSRKALLTPEESKAQPAGAGKGGDGKDSKG
jgi:predicted RNA-binding protein with RPS1 domain